MKKTILTIGLAFLIGANLDAFAQVTRFYVDGPKPATLEDLVELSSIIVEATVETAYPVVDQPRPLSDFLIRVNRVIKGSLPSNQIAVAQFGGTKPDGRTFEPGMYALMAPGQRYILFLNIGQTNLPDRGVPRYELSADNYGLVRIEGSQVVWSKGMPETWKTKYRFQSDNLIAAITAQSRTH